MYNHLFVLGAVLFLSRLQPLAAASTRGATVATPVLRRSTRYNKKKLSLKLSQHNGPLTVRSRDCVTKEATNKSSSLFVVPIN